MFVLVLQIYNNISDSNSFQIRELVSRFVFGFKALNFYREYVSEQTALITLGFIFNFSPIASSGGYQYDSKAFLFSLVNKPGWAPGKLPQTGKYSSLSRSIYCGSSYGPIFGGGHDIRIYNYASSNSQSQGNLGHTYSPPSGYSYGSTFARTFLAGSQFFTPDEVETFYVTN